MPRREGETAEARQARLDADRAAQLLIREGETPEARQACQQQDITLTRIRRASGK